MKNLIIVRHAKSSWDSPVRDIDRILTERGIKDANLVSKNIIGRLPEPITWWCSPAKRAFETAKIFAKNHQILIENIEVIDSLYTFDESKLESFIRLASDDVHNVILFGHNEAITNFVNKFGDIYIGNVSTAGVVALQFNTDSWQNITSGTTMYVVFPRDLKK